MMATHLVYPDGSVLPDGERHRGEWPGSFPCRTTGGFRLWNSHHADHIWTRFILTPSGWAFVMQDRDRMTAHRGSSKEFYEGPGRKWAHGSNGTPSTVATAEDAEAARVWLVAQASHTCGMCGTLVFLFHTKPERSERLKMHQWCTRCEFWFERASEKDDPATVRVRGTHYRMGGRTSGSLRGFGGAKFRVRFFDGRKAECSDMWCQGEIPEWFREMMPDNAVFLSEGAEVVLGDLEIEQGHPATVEQLREFGEAGRRPR